MLRRVIKFKSLANMRFTYFSDQKPPKGFERFDRPQVQQQQPERQKFQNPPEDLKQSGGGGNENQVSKLIFQGSSFPLFSLLLALGAGHYFVTHYITQETIISYSQFVNDLLSHTRQIDIHPDGESSLYASIKTTKGNFKLKLGNPDTFLENLEKQQQDAGIPQNNFIKVNFHVPYNYKLLSDMLDTGVFLGLNALVIIIGLRLYRQFKSSGLMGMFKQGQKSYSLEEKINTKFADVAGLDEAKKEITEFVEFLKNSAKFKNLGAKIPRGALLTGPPGTGKTMLAKACAGESGVPFFYVSGSEFVEVFVGMGASRVRDLFQQAKAKAPSIIFIDEIDAIGKQRRARGGNDEGDNTLNSLLVEMDGFGTDTNVVVLAATNLPEQLDAALTRPGRLDRNIDIQLPDIEGRKQIFLVHLKGLTLAPGDINDYARRLSTLTPGFSGAEIANLCNEAAILAARQSKKFIEPYDFEMAAERVMAGLPTKSILSPLERKTVAYHESGHAAVSWFLEGGDPLLKLTIIPRSKGSLGYAQYLPNESSLQTKQELLDKICCILGGRCSEQFFFKQVTTGAYDDLKKANQIAYSIVTKFGMNESIGYLGFKDGDYSQTYSDSTSKLIDDQVRLIIKEQTARTFSVIEKYSEQVKSLSEALLEKETLDLNQLVQILGQRPFAPKSNFKAFLETKLAV